MPSKNITATKNSTGRRNGKASKVDHLKDLAFHLSAVLNNPRCPSVLYNSITEATASMSSQIDYNTSEMVEKSIRAYVAFERKRTSE